MKTATLLKVWVVLILGWLFLLGPGMVDLYRGWQRTGGYREALFLLMGVRLILSALVLALVVHVLYRRGVRQRADLGEIDASLIHTLPGTAQFFSAAGLALVVAQFPVFSSAGMMLGLAVTAGGGALLCRDTLRTEPGQKLMRISHLFGRPMKTTELILPHTGRIRVGAVYRRGTAVSVGDLTVVDGLDYGGALRIAQSLELLLGRTIDDEIERERDETLPLGLRIHAAFSKLLLIGFLILLVAVPILWFIPDGRTALCGFATSYLLLDDAPYVPYVEEACGKGPGEESPPGRSE